MRLHGEILQYHWAKIITLHNVIVSNTFSLTTLTLKALNSPISGSWHAINVGVRMPQKSVLTPYPL